MGAATVTRAAAFVLAGALGVAACNSARAPAQQENLGATSSALFAAGTPCALPTQCTSGFCVDGVCCTTACGAGARDTQSCSNVYGVVPGLVDGTCTNLVPGNPCGSLETVSPCTWRGTVINGGGNCPNPPGGASACFPCANAGDCSGAFPICDNGACVACTTDFGGAGAACPAATPVCTAGTCVQCDVGKTGACTGTTPTCNTATNTCAGCNGDNGAPVTRPCPTAGARACLATGACAQCSATNATACAGTTPACDVAAGTCAACNGDNGSGATAACPTAADPFCFLAGGNAGACGKCAGNADCVGNPAGPVCDLVTGACGAGCVTDANCPATSWCNAAGVCVAKTPNGQPLPAAAPINGTCTVANGTRVCVSGACSAVDNRCGLPNDATCGPPPNDAICRSGTCFAADNKCGLPKGQPCVGQADCRGAICSPSNKCGDCNADADCGAVTSGKVCSDQDKVCGDGCRGTGGNRCAAGKVCTSTTAAVGKCVDCTTDAQCGNATSGRICDAATNTCAPGCRGQGGNGCAPNTKCTSQDGSVGACIGCATDADCGNATSGQVCDATDKTCKAGCRGQGGNGCPTTEVCSSTTSDIGKCGPRPTPDAGVPVTGCTVDADCGGAASGRVCDPASKQCVDGCRGSGGNGCAADAVCSSTSSSIGTCAPRPVEGGELGGGGLTCSAGPSRDAGGTGASVALVALAALIGLRRPRRRAA